MVGATGATKWSADKKVATDVVTFSSTYKYTPPTQAQIDAAAKITSSSTSNSSTTAPKPELTVVSGLQFVQVTTLSPTVIGT